MERTPVISLALNAQLPFISPLAGSSLKNHSAVEAGNMNWFFESLSETYIPLLGALGRLEQDHIPFRLGIVFSPLLCRLLEDREIISRYLDYTDRQIEFGEQELKRTEGQGGLHELVKFYHDWILEKRFAFVERYEQDILKTFRYYQKKGWIEFLASSATGAFLPFYTGYPEAIQAQMEVSLSNYRSLFGRHPQGFWLTDLGWSAGLDPYLRMYNTGYTIVESHALLFGNPPASRASFYPVRTPAGVLVMARDYFAGEDYRRQLQANVYRDNRADAGYELPLDLVKDFLGPGDSRSVTGYKYWNQIGRFSPDGLYNPREADAQAHEDARVFLQRRIDALLSAAKQMEENPLCLCAFNADDFGRYWHEGPRFIEELFRAGAGHARFMTPAEYLYKQETSSMETSMPEFSSAGESGYAESWLDASNDWIYRHLARAVNRMTELAERFPNDTGLKERALNQAAREILLAQNADCSRMLHKEEHTDYARSHIESCLRNFTTIYEALGSNYISTEWLTAVERMHDVFPHINYRIFRRKI
ncbi:MAG: DUF1957 domain-containing protein [Treponema sp.]|jgi:1,4-alpha-glucan branching enzyme|nr:DUF1957 domain-containing protein [Treponema sp.]